MKLPLKLGSARADKKNGGEFYVVKDAEGAWIGDIRAEHAPEIVAFMNGLVRPEAGFGEDIMHRLYHRLAPLALLPADVSPGDASLPYVKLNDVETAIREELFK